ncbi:FMN-binding protein [Alicyclobacillus acidiphilus]|uniref:FMN-binding protein n=1 Tax=Alicyclobacillus acidiphilus TaxID=182455 RepID=UPI00083335B9|nr:FMN-binding protein [Alicyclobacillus acidiphilus]
MAKMSKQLIALCTIALGTIYTAGYLVTNPADETPAAQTTTSNEQSPASTKPGSSTKPASSNQPGSSTQSSSNKQSSSSDKPSSKASKPQPKYLDGTYYGSGTDQIGTVSVAVTIQGGKIANVEITACETHYPESYIDPVLPDQVVARQNANIDYVSGATLSSYDFANAVQQALQEALNPKYSG